MGYIYIYIYIYICFKSRDMIVGCYDGLNDRHVFNSILKNNEFTPKINEFYS